MRHCGLALLAVFALLLCPGLRGAGLPEPPGQRLSWIPHKTKAIPGFVVPVTARLFDAGLADPRGGVYRSVEVFESGTERNGSAHTRGWVLPGGIAVCWNGLVYRVKSAGELANLEADVKRIAVADPWRDRSFPRLRTDDRPSRAERVAEFWTRFRSYGSMAPTSIALLLRLGRVDLAERLWSADGKREDPDEGLWLADAAMSWFGTAYWRLVSAFDAGDDRDAAELGESIVEWRSRVPDEWRVENKWFPKRVPDISFLNAVPVLAADARRRLSQPWRQSIDLTLTAYRAKGPQAAAFARRPQGERIALLVERLDDMVAGKFAISGPVMYQFAPVYRLLVREGEGAVDALADVIRNDDRLTRTFDYSRPWMIDYRPIAVRDVAKLVLAEILMRRLR